jgi:2-aminobenzoate-CoA ligase
MDLQQQNYDRFVLDRLPPQEEWPEFIFNIPEVSYPEYLNATVELLDNAILENYGNHTAMIGSEIRWSYSEFSEIVNQICHVLIQDASFLPGNRVLLRGSNSPWLAACWLAVFKVGGVAVGTMPLLRQKELSEIVHIAEISHAFCDWSLKDELIQTQENSSFLKHIIYYGKDGALSNQMARHPKTFDAYPTKANTPALIGFTSGTTGTPKGTIHFHRDVMAMCEIFPGFCLKPNTKDIFIGTPPLAFTFGLGGLLCFPLWARAATVLIEKLSPDLLLDAIEKYSATICFTSPTGYRSMTKSLRLKQIQSLKKCVSAGEALPVDTRKAWKKVTSLDIYDGIGGTEMIHIYIASDPSNYREGSIGKVLPGYIAKVVDEQMQEVPIGEVGKLAIKGPTGCKYLADPRQKNYVQHGWNLPGDVFHQDHDGYFYYHARIDDMIVTSGYNVSSPEVEWALLEHPSVAECGVIGVPDHDRGQIIKAYIVLRTGFEGNEELTKELQNFVKNQVAPYKYPRAIEYLPSLPRTETGKLQRFRLKKMNGIS